MNNFDSDQLRSNRRVVLIGSMGVYPQLLECARSLEAWDIKTVVPEPEGEAVQQLSVSDFEEFKRRVSFAYLRKIRDPRTYAVLAVNLDRHGILNYIGPNTFAEIAVALAQSKKVYLLQGVPESYRDELSAWGAIPLRGELQSLIGNFRDDCMVRDPQMRFFD